MAHHPRYRRRREPDPKPNWLQALGFTVSNIADMRPHFDHVNQSAFTLPDGLICRDFTVKARPGQPVVIEYEFELAK